MNRILEVREKDPKQELMLCRKLRTKIKISEIDDNISDRYAQCFADTYLCEAYNLLGEIKESLKLGLKTVKITQKEQYDELTMILSNLLGYCFLTMDDYENSSQWLLKAMEIAKRFQDGNMLGIINFNIGENYFFLERYDRAGECFQTGMDLVKQYVDDPANLERLRRRFLISKALCDVKEQKDEEAMEGIREYIVEEISPEICLILAMVKVQQNQREDAESFLRELLLKETNDLNKFECCMIYHEAYELILSMDHEELAQQYISKIYTVSEELDLPNIYFHLYDKILEGCQQFGWTNRLDEMYERYFYWNQQVYHKNRERVLSSMQNQMQIFTIQNKEETLMKKVKRLEKVSMKDELTNAYTRATYEEYCKESLEQMKAENKSFGLAVVQIDGFQKLNENIGPKQANKCLQIVTKAIKEAFLEKGRVYRMTGAEFIVLSKGIPMLAYIQSLQKLCKNKNISSFVTDQIDERKTLSVSIGAVNCKPDEQAIVMDYAMAADKLLFMARKQKESSYQFSDHLDQD